MECRRVYSLEELITMDKEETARLILALQDEAAQSVFALEDTTRRYSEQVREKDARIARLEEENAALSEENEILKAALGDRKSIIKVRNHERYGRSTENLKVLLSGILPGMDEKEKAGILDHLEKLLSDKNIQDDPAGTDADDPRDNSQEPEKTAVPVKGRGEGRTSGVSLALSAGISRMAQPSCSGSTGLLTPPTRSGNVSG